MDSNSNEELGIELLLGLNKQEKQFMSLMNFTDEIYDAIPNYDLHNEEINNAEVNYCMDSMAQVGQSYRMVHGYISLIVCFAGILMNILIIMVLTRKEMLTPINRMLTALATADIIVMSEYIPFALHMYVLDLPEEEQYSYLWAVFVLFHSHITQILHTINIQLTISMSIWRYLALKRSTKSSSFLTLKRCNLCILAAYICPIIICIPNYLTFSIYHRERLYLREPFDRIINMEEDPNLHNFMKLCENIGEFLSLKMNCTDILIRQDRYTVDLSNLAKSNNGVLHRYNFWIFSVFVKLFPCVVLTFFMLWLVKTLYDTKKRHKMLQERNNMSSPRTTTTLSKMKSNNSMKMMIEGNCAATEEVQPNTLNKADGINVEHVQNPKEDYIDMRRLPSASALDGNHCSRKSSITERKQEDMTQLKEECKSNITLSPIRIVEPSNNHLITSAPQHHMESQSLNRLDHLVLSNSNYLTQDSFDKSSNTSIASDGKDSNHIKHSIKIPNQQKEQRLSSADVSYNELTVPSHTIITKKPSLMRKSGKRNTDRTSKLLIAVLCLFLLTEIPQGIMAFLSGIYGEQFFKNCYNTFAEIWDILALVNSSINFILYCFMSKQFRLQFHSIFKLPEKWRCPFKPKATYL